MKDKIVFLIIGMLLATISFYANKTNVSDAERSDEVTGHENLKVDNLTVTEKLTIGEFGDTDDKSSVIIKPSKDREGITLMMQTGEKVLSLETNPKAVNIGLVGNINKPTDSSIVLIVSDKEAGVMLEDILSRKLITSHGEIKH